MTTVRREFAAFPTIRCSRRCTRSCPRHSGRRPRGLHPERLRGPANRPASGARSWGDRCTFGAEWPAWEGGRPSGTAGSAASGTRGPCPAPPPTISLIPGGAASPAGQGSRSPAESSHFGIGDPGKCRPLAPSKRVNVLSPGRSRYSAAFVATHRFWFSSVETPTTGISWMPSCQLYCTLLIGHGPGPPNLIPPPSAGPESAGPASAGPASTEGSASTVGPASTGTMLFPGSVTLLFAQAAPISAPAIAHFPPYT